MEKKPKRAHTHAPRIKQNFRFEKKTNLWSAWRSKKNLLCSKKDCVRRKTNPIRLTVGFYLTVSVCVQIISRLVYTQQSESKFNVSVFFSLCFFIAIQVLFFFTSFDVRFFSFRFIHSVCFLLSLSVLNAYKYKLVAFMPCMRRGPLACLQQITQLFKNCICVLV